MIKLPQDIDVVLWSAASLMLAYLYYWRSGCGSLQRTSPGDCRWKPVCCTVCNSIDDSKIMQEHISGAFCFIFHFLWGAGLRLSDAMWSSFPSRNRHARFWYSMARPPQAYASRSKLILHGVKFGETRIVWMHSLPAICQIISLMRQFKLVSMKQGRRGMFKGELLYCL